MILLYKYMHIFKIEAYQMQFSRSTGRQAIYGRFLALNYVFNNRQVTRLKLSGYVYIHVVLIVSCIADLFGNEYRVNSTCRKRLLSTRYFTLRFYSSIQKT